MVEFNCSHFAKFHVITCGTQESLCLLQIRKRDWTVDGVPLLAKMNLKLQTAQRACVVQQRFLKPDPNTNLSRSYSNGKLPKTIIRDTHSLLMDVADACIVSPWRRLKSCEALVGSLVSVVAQAGALHGSQMFKIILLRFKGLLLAACAQVSYFALWIHLVS